MENIGNIELSAIVVLLTLSLLFSLFVYFGMHPIRRIQSLLASFLGFTRLHPGRIIVVLFLILISGNILIIYYRIGLSPGVLAGVIGGITVFLVAVLINFLARFTIGGWSPSAYIQLLAVLDSSSPSVDSLTHGMKIGIETYGPPFLWMKTALDTYGISFVPVIINQGEIFEALKSGAVDVVIVTKHPAVLLDEPVALGEVQFLPWSKKAIKAVTMSFPIATRPAVLPPHAYANQPGKIIGYASS